MSNHVFPRPCRDPSNADVLSAALMLTNPAYALSAGNERAAFQTLCDAFHGDANAAGWYHNVKTGQPKALDNGERLMLAVSELAEAMEGHRKNLLDDKLPHRQMIEVELADFNIRCFDTMGTPAIEWPALDMVPKRFALESVVPIRNVGRRLLHITGCLVRANTALDFGINGSLGNGPWASLRAGILYAFDLGRLLGLDVPGAMVEKRDCNRTRTDHSVAARLADGGKAY